MPNERVSQLLDLFAQDIQSDDIFLVTDTSQRESKKLGIGQLLLFIENSGSFFAFDASHSQTASYILASNVDGISSTITNVSHSISSSFADNSISSSYALNADTASYSNVCVTHTTDADTSSYLNYSGFPNGTSSYSVQSLSSETSSMSLNLFFDGITPNGIVSLAITASNSNTSSYSISASNSNTSSYSVTSSYSINSDTSGYSISAQTASYINKNFGPTFITPIIVTSSMSSTGWITYRCPTQHIPIGTSIIILDGWALTPGHGSFTGFVEIRKDPSSPYYILLSSANDASGISSSGGQGTFPCASSNSNSSSFQYSFTQPATAGTTLRLIGYY